MTEHLGGLAAVNALLEMRARQREAARLEEEERTRSRTIYIDAPQPALADLLRGKPLWKNMAQVEAEALAAREKEKLERDRIVPAPEVEF